MVRSSGYLSLSENLNKYNDDDDVRKTTAHIHIYRNMQACKHNHNKEGHKEGPLLPLGCQSTLKPDAVFSLFTSVNVLHG